MRKQDFNKNWRVRPLGEDVAWNEVNLPHDAMIHETRSNDSDGMHNIGWFDAKDYEYETTFFVEKDKQEKHLVLEFEGVYHNAEVYVNGKKACFHPYGYTGFYVTLDDYITYGEKNTLRVIARNSDQPNSRWYSGTGIYRPVWLYELPKEHIALDGVKVKTLSIAPIRLGIKAEVYGGKEEVTISILDQEGKVVLSQKGPADHWFEVELEEGNLRSPESPYLYQLKVSYGEDEVTEEFGIRELRWTPKEGMTINGKRVLLKGACIHHDNGVLGACAYDKAEERKVRLHLEQGYNALRSAHNPCSKALLRACDRLGMLVMDEYVDAWYIHKTKYDYVNYLMENWQQDLKDMVDKDFNHPSVIMYSTGNEVAETAQKKGIKLTQDFTDRLHELDDSRPVSCGINIFFNFLSSAGFGVYSDDKAEEDTKKKQKPVGSEFYNTLAGIFGDKTMKLGATIYACDVKTRDAYAAMDIAGYNYGILRYKKDLRKYPSRLILGSETFCKDAWQFMEIAKENPRIIGDFVWAGMDYIGEAGIGAWEYEDYAPKDAPEWGWLTAGSGRIDILGNPNGEAAYTRVVFDKQKKPAIAVKPVYQRGKHSPSAWKMTDALESWTYPRCEGMNAFVEVYGKGESCELFLNGVSLGKKRLGKECRTRYKLTYAPGILQVKIFDKEGKLLGENSLYTASEETILNVTPEESVIHQGDLVYIPIRYTDEKGVLKPMEKHQVSVKVEGGTLLGLGNACSYNKDGYDKDQTFTYYGQALCVVKAKEDANEVVVSVSDETNRLRQVTIGLRQL